MIERTVLVSLLSALVIGPCSAQNLLVNPGLDSVAQLDGWICNETYGVATWSPIDRLGDPLSGSMQHDMAATVSNRSMWCAQCVVVQEGSSYVASAWAYWPDDPDVSQLGTTRASIWFYPNIDCSGTAMIGPTETVNVPLDTWTLVSTDITLAPPTSQSAIVFFLTWQNAADEAVRARLDDLEFGSAGLIFADGFESGDTTAWEP